MLVLPAVAPAVPPSNDKFASRLVLGPGFPEGVPITVSGDNFEAGEEAEEHIPGLAPAGHSVWFEWEAASDGWVSIGACDADFPTILAVFTGDELEDLTQVAGNNSGEGPDCPFQYRQFTFQASAGTKYVIAVDGNAFTGPEAVPVETEGKFVLEIKETPLPPNDEFENATVLKGETSEEPNGARRYMAHTQGFNWNAENEHGEPEELLSAASVWYSWTAPEDGTYGFSDPCCGGLDLDLYTGNAVDELDPVLVGEKFGEVDLTAGQTLRLRVSGPIDPETEAPRMGFFSLIVSGELAPKPSPPPGGDPPASPPPPDTRAPQTTITKTVLKRKPPVFLFKFRSDEPGSSFRCSLDGGKFKPCGSSRRIGHATPGRHKLKVVAVDAAGNADPTPAVGRFKFPRPQHPQGRGVPALNG